MRKLIISMGDAAGVGPEVTVHLAAELKNYPDFDSLIIGEKWILENAAEILNSGVIFCDENNPVSGAVKVRSMGILQPGDYDFGILSVKCGEGAFQYFSQGVDMCLAGSADGIISAPINKEAINKAGHHFIGHTEILEKKTGCSVVMTIVHPKLFVLHVTDHLPLRDAIDSITPQRIEEVVKLSDSALKAKGIRSPEIAVAGINPHAGENGLLGREEIEIIIPVLEQLKRSGYNVHGPCPADTVFMEALQGKYDAVVAMYHDQGFIPVKTLDLAHGVNCTLGIPFVRTSPDHGTAFNIAGTGKADPTSMIEAWKLACELVRK